MYTYCVVCLTEFGYNLVRFCRIESSLTTESILDGHENDDFDTTTASTFKLSFDSKGFGVKNHAFYVLNLVHSTSLIIR